MAGVGRQPGMFASALGEPQKKGTDPPVKFRKREKSVDRRHGILACGLRELRKAAKELEADRNEGSTRSGILGTALEELKGVPQTHVGRS